MTGMRGSMTRTACALSAFLTAAAAAQSPTAVGDLMQQHPGVQAHGRGERITAVFGGPMTRAATPAEAAALWWRDHANVFGVPEADLRLVRSNQVGHGELVVFAYEQSIDGVPVEGAPVRLLVRQGWTCPVLYVAAKLARQPQGGFPADAIDATTALAIVQAMEPWSKLKEWSAPELVVFNGETNDGPGPAIRAWRFQGGDLGVAGREKYSFFVGASTGCLAHVRDDVYHGEDVYGHVGGLGSPDVLPDVPYNPPVELDIADDEVRIVGGASAYTDRDGNYVILNDLTEPVMVEVDLLEGRWVRVLNGAGENLFLQQVVTPPGPADFLFNDSPYEYATSQVNGFVMTALSHDFFKDRQPDFEGLDISLLCLVNYEGACDAYFNGVSMMFLRAGSIGQFDCPNTCYSSVVAHEYGHFVHAAHGLGGGAFSEGYADTYALLMFDHPLVGADFLGEGTSVRDYTEECEDYQYPCTGVLPPCGTEVIEQNISHGCAKLLAGVWWKINLNIQDTMGELPGLEYVRQLFTDWTEITLGGQGYNSAHPQTAIEVLTVDDDDGDLENGTPHYAEICAAFAAHGIDCPGIAGDVNGDGIVDTEDLLLLLGAWGPCPQPPDDCPADFDGNGVVNTADLLILLANWG